MKPSDDASISASLAERLAFERLLADLSVTYANVPGNRVVEEIEHGLGRLNAFLGFDRSTFWEFAPNGDRIALCSAAPPRRQWARLARFLHLKRVMNQRAQ